jgi:portal protein
MAFMDRLRKLWHAWNAFDDEDRTVSLRNGGLEAGSWSSRRPDRPQIRMTNERSIVSSILNRMAVDAAGVPIRHVRLDDEGRYQEDIDSGLNNCLTVEANTDQGATHFRQDVMWTLFDKGCAAIVAVDTTINPALSAAFDVKTLRVGEIVAWYPQHVQVMLYNEKRGLRQQVTLPKADVAIVENPFYAVMNEPSSTLQRLIRKLNMLDNVDEESSSGRLDIIIQLPYVVKSESRRTAAEQRRKEIEHQLRGSQYGIAWLDGTEKVTQLNRPAENNLLKQIEMLTSQLYTQLGLTPEIVNGTAGGDVMLNYVNRTVGPLVTAVVEAMHRTFLSRTARAQGQAVMNFYNLFKFVPLTELAEIADKFTRNEIVTGNEFRGFLGIKPSKEPKADQLRNPNMPDPTAAPSEPNQLQPTGTGGGSQNGT